MIDECLMSEDCPAYDRDRRMCLVHPGDCEFAPADGEAALMIETSEVLTPDTSASSSAGMTLWPSW
jgi:hypothetical protein